MKSMPYFDMNNGAQESFDAGKLEREVQKPEEGKRSPEQKLASNVYGKLHGAESQELLTPANLHEEEKALAQALADMGTLEALNA